MCAGLLFHRDKTATPNNVMSCTKDHENCFRRVASRHRSAETKAHNCAERYFYRNNETAKQLLPVKRFFNTYVIPMAVKRTVSHTPETHDTYLVMPV